jgi:hypothetical protein
MPSLICVLTNLIPGQSSAPPAIDKNSNLLQLPTTKIPYLKDSAARLNQLSAAQPEENLRRAKIAELKTQAAGGFARAVPNGLPRFITFTIVRASSGPRGDEYREKLKRRLQELEVAYLSRI